MLEIDLITISRRARRYTKIILETETYLAEKFAFMEEVVRNEIGYKLET